MSTATGLREVTDDDLDHSLEQVLLPRLSAVLSARGAGHCVRVDDLQGALAARLTRRLRGQLGEGVQAYVLGASPQIPDDVAITGSKLVELRNPEADGSLRPVLLIFVPPGSQASAEDSFGVATFEDLALGDAYPDLARRLLGRLPDALRQGVSEVFDVLDGEAGPRGLTGDGELAKARYLLALSLNENDREAAGAAVYELGLIPDFELFTDQAAVLRHRVTLNTRQVRILDRSDRSVRQRVVDLHLQEPDFRSRLADLVVRTGLDDLRVWTRRIVADSANWPLSFHRWPLPDAEPVESIGLNMGELPLPRAGDQADHSEHPILANVTGQPYLISGAGGLTQLAVPFEVVSDPRQVTGLAKFVVEIISEESGPTGTRASVALSTTSRRAYRATLRRLRTAQLDPGWHYLRVLPFSHDNLPLPVAPVTSSDGRAPEESERFLVLTGDGLDEPDTTPRTRRSLGVTHELRALELSSTQLERDDPSVECTGVAWEPRSLSVLEARFGSHGHVEIPLAPALVQAERALLQNPQDLSQRRMSTTPGLPARLLPSSSASVPIDGIPITDEFRQARAVLMEAVRGDTDMVIEARDIRALREPILVYAESYTDLLARLMRAAERPEDGSAALRDLAFLLQIDTVVVDHRDSHHGEHELTLVSPTHPLRLLWLLTWAELGRSWAERADSTMAGSLTEALFELQPSNFPLAVPRRDGRLSLAARDLGPYWQVAVPSETADPATLLGEFAASLEVRDATPAVATDVSSGRLADCVERYARLHPYVNHLVVCAVNAGRAERLADMLIDLQRRPRTSHLTYEIRLFTLDPQAPGTGEALAELLNGRWGSAAEADAFQTPARIGTAAKLSVAVRSLAEFRSATNNHAAHLTFLIEAFSPESFGVGHETPPAPAPVHGLVQAMVTEYHEDDDAISWHKQPRNARIAEPATDDGRGVPASDVSNLLTTLATLMTRAAGAVATGEVGTSQVPRTTLSLTGQDQALLHQAHRSSDWVVTIDRTLGVEYFDGPGSLRRPEYVIDFESTGQLGQGHQLVISSRSVEELHALLVPMLQQHGFDIDRRHAGTFFDQLRLLSGRLAFKIASTAPNQRTEVLGLALARLYLDFQGVLDDQVLVPLDSHLELYRDVRRKTDNLNEGVGLKRTDLALFTLDAQRRTVVCRLVEVKCYTSLGNVADVQRIRERISEQIDRSAEVLTDNFDPDRHTPDVPDRAVRNLRLAALLRFHLGRAVRHQVMTTEAADEASWLLDHLDEGFRWEITRTGLIFDLSAQGATSDLNEGIEYHVLGKDVVEDLLGGLGTDPVLAAGEHRESQQSSPSASDTTSVPRLRQAAFRSPERSHHIPRDEIPTVAAPHRDDQPTVTTGRSLQAASGDESSEPRSREPVERISSTSNGPEATRHASRATGSLNQASPSEVVAAPTEAGFPNASRGDSNRWVPDMFVGSNAPSIQFGVLGETFGRRLALDLNETHTISLFGVQGAGKSYTLGSIIEAASLPALPVNELPNPLATIVFHYSPTPDYAPEFTSMVAPNDDVAQVQRLRDQYGVEPAALSDVVMLVPASQLGQRSAEYPNIDVRPLAFASTELQARHWRFLMGAVGNQATYVRQLKVIMRSIRDRLTLQNLRDGVDQSSQSDTIKQLAHQRLDFAAEYIDDSIRVGDLVRPGRMIVVDLRDDLIEKDEALGLFVVLMEIFASAGSEGQSFNKLVVFDEAHKYIESPELVASLVESVREMRHKGMSILVASQDPPSVPLELIELSDLMILHRFNSPGWLKHLQKVSTALAGLSSSRLNSLAPGEAYVWASRATDPSITREAVKVSLRPRLTRHGGATRLAVGGDQASR